ncbi:MAG TPA: hypothetical protein VIF40_18175 [Methylosinus sp.]|uniref:hypothetical protein n=1 Tax=Methylosinus sp. TaxID=427 RepID=UPI002F9476C9
MPIINKYLLDNAQNTLLASTDDFLVAPEWVSIMTMNAQFRTSLSMSQWVPAVLGAAPVWSGSFEQIINLTAGNSTGQVDVGYAAERTVASATNDDIDLSGVLTDVFGNPVTMAKLVALLIINKQRDGTPNTTNLTPGGGTNTIPGFSSALWPIGPGGIFKIVSPAIAGLATVTANTGDILRIANSAGAQAKYQIVLLGRSS